MTKRIFTKMTRAGSAATLCAGLAAVLAAMLVALAPAAAPAEAAFPGHNGKIAYYTAGDVWTVNPDGTGAARLTSDYNYEGSPAVSPDGSKIAYEFLRGVWVMNADGSGKKRLTDGASTDEDPMWSADGRRIIFSRNADLWTVNASDGSGQANLTATPDREEFDPAVSPDGSRIAYTSSCIPHGGGTCIYVMGADGSGRTNLTPEDSLPQCPNSPGYFHNGASRQPAWSPDGAKIAFSGALICPHVFGKDIWVMNADGSGKTNIVNDEGTSDSRPAFSPDGSRIVFESDRGNNSGRTELFVMDADGSGIQRLDGSGAWATDPDWGTPPLDTDADNVPDYKDACPTQPANTVNGCPAPIPPPANTAPVVINPRPVPNKITRDVTPTISATVRDAQTNLGKANIRLYLDGKKVTGFSYAAATDRLYHTPRKLVDGRHTVKVVATDAAGLATTKSWRFTVK